MWERGPARNGIYHRHDITGTIVARLRSAVALAAAVGVFVATLTAAFTAASAKGRGQDPIANKAELNELFKQFESPSRYDPRKFVAIKRVEAATAPSGNR